MLKRQNTSHLDLARLGKILRALFTQLTWLQYELIWQFILPPWCFLSNLACIDNLYESHLNFCSVLDVCILNSDRPESRYSFYNIEDSKITTDNLAMFGPISSELHCTLTRLLFEFCVRTKVPAMNEEWVALQVKVPFLELYAQFFLSPFYILTWLLSKWRAWYSWSHHDFDKCRY